MITVSSTLTNSRMLGTVLNDLTYHIWESEVLTELCAPVEKKTIGKPWQKMSEFVNLKNLNKGCILKLTFFGRFFKTNH